MKKEKTWVSYPLWLLFTIVTGINIAVPLVRCGRNLWGAGSYLTAAAIGLVFCAIAGIWFAGRRLIRAAGRKSERIKHWKNKRERKQESGTGKRYKAGQLEYVLLLCLCGGALACRLYLFGYFSGSTEGSVFYDMASVKAGGGVPWNAHGASYLYTMVLSFVLSFAGNKVTAGVILQLVLQMITLPFVYAAVKSLAGRMEAVCALAVIAFSPLFCGEIFSLAPETLYFFLFVFGWFCCGMYWRGLCRDRERAEDAAVLAGHAGMVRWYVRSVLCGCYIGFIGFLDVTGWTLLCMFLFLSVRGGRRKKAGGEGKAAMERHRFAAGIAAVFLAALFSFFIFLGLFGLPVLAAGQSYGKVLAEWKAAQIRSVSFFLTDISAFFEGMLSFSRLHLVVCVCAAFTVVGFWFRKEQKQELWIVVLLILEGFRIFGIGSMEYGMLLTAVWGVLAGIGICSMGMEREPEALYSVAEQEESAGPSEEKEKEDGKAEDREEKKEKRKTENKTENREERKTEGKEETVQAGKKSDTEKGSAEEKPKVKLIENPLPLPKKHVKREMTYAKEVKGEEMDFDIAVAEDDDFDI